MKKKIFYILLVFIIVAGTIVIATMGLKADIIYSKNVRIDVYLGKEYNHDEIEQMAKEIFETNRTIIRQVEYFGDMFSLTISQDIENIDEKVDEFTDKINEIYELPEDGADVTVTYQPKVRLSSIIMPYLVPIGISVGIILIYAIVRFRKIGILRTLGVYILAILASEAVYLSILAILRIPVNRLVTPIGLAIYVIVITIVTAKRERMLENNKSAEAKK